ncbi:hypothetical protein QT973_25300 [Microcoleus sp. Z1_A1]
MITFVKFQDLQSHSPPPMKVAPKYLSPGGKSWLRNELTERNSMEFKRLTQKSGFYV